MHENENADGGGSYSSVIVAKYRFKLVNHDDLQVSCNPREAVAMEPANGMVMSCMSDEYNALIASIYSTTMCNVVLIQKCRSV